MVSGGGTKTLQNSAIRRVRKRGGVRDGEERQREQGTEGRGERSADEAVSSPAIYRAIAGRMDRDDDGRTVGGALEGDDDAPTLTERADRKQPWPK